MKDEDFRECGFINELMRFIDLKDFVKNSDLIHLYYRTLSFNGKLFYKWYVYANIHLNEQQKNACWDYLNDYTNKAEFFLKLRSLGCKF